MGVWSNRCCLKIQKPLLNSVTHILMGHRSLQPTGLAAGCFYVHASDTSGPPQRHRRGQFSKLQLTLTAENCSEAHILPGHFTKYTLRLVHVNPHPSGQRHIGTSSLPHTYTQTQTHSGHLSSGKYLPQGQTWQGIPMRSSVISVTSAPFCSLFLEMALEPQMTKAMVQ